jgi:hypothetical protein
MDLAFDDMYGCWTIVQILRQRWWKTINAAPTTLSAIIQAASQSTFINAQLNSTCD